MLSHNAPIAAVILAAGRSMRLGRPKQLLPLGDRPLLDWVLLCVRRSSVDLRYVVLGHAADDISAAVNLDDFHVIRNRSYNDGQSSSVRAAVEELTGKVAAAIFVLGDQPLQAPEIIDQIVQSYRESPAPIIQPRYAEGPGNPVLIDHSIFDQLAYLEGDVGAKPVLQEQRESIRLLDVTHRHRPSDVDTWEDYERLKLDYTESEATGDA